MSKKKNTLKDLDEFLKQQASTLAAPVQLSAKIDQEEVVAPPPAATSVRVTEISSETILHDLEVLAQKEGAAFHHKFYDLIVRSLETRAPASAEDKMLINTALFLKNGDNWREAIRAYWRERS